MWNPTKLESMVTLQYSWAINNIFNFFLFATILTSLLFIIAYLLSFVFEQNREKISEYECGFEPFDNATRQTFDVQFYIVGILFLIFDVEIALFFPWSAYIEDISIFGYYIMVLFLFIITLGFFYEWHIGALNWPKNKNSLYNDNFILFLVPNLYLYDTETFVIALFSIVLIIIALSGVNTSVTSSGNIVRKSKVASYTLLMLSTYALYICLYTSFKFINTHLKYNSFSDLTGFLSNYIINDIYTTTLRYVLLISIIIVLLLSYRFLYRQTRSLLEYSVLLIFTAFFLSILLSSSNLITIFISILGFSLNLYVLLLCDIENYASREASIKYFFLSATSSAFMSLGIVFAYFLFKSTDYVVINNILQQWSTLNVQVGTSFILKFMLITILIGSLLKLSAVPCHLWTPDVYSGSPHVITFVFVVPIKVAVFGFFLRMLTFTFNDLFDIWHFVIYLSTAASLVYGAVLAYDEKQIKRFWAFSSINQMGLLLMGLTTGSVYGIHASLLFLLVYVITNCIFFIIFLVTNNTTGNSNSLLFLTDFTTFVKYNGISAILLTFVFFSLAGIPPFAGFFSKYFLLVHAMDSSLYVLSAIVLLTNLISTYYYFRFIKVLWFDTTNIAGIANSRFMRPMLNEFGLSFVIILYTTILTTFIFLIPSVISITKTIAQVCITLF